MKTNTVISIFIIFLLSVMNMNAHAQFGRVFEDSVYNTSNGNLKVIIQEGQEEYVFLIQETTKILPGLWESDEHYTPFRSVDISKFGDHLYDVFLPLILSNYPFVKDAIMTGKISSFSLQMRFDDKKELIDKGFLIYGFAKELPIIHQIVKEVVSDARLLTLVKQGAEKIYNLFPPMKREELPEKAKAVLAKGIYDFLEEIIVSINKGTFQNEKSAFILKLN